MRNRKKRLKPEGNIGIRELGHRKYVGGLWDEIGTLQFNLLVQQGLKPSHCFLDIACGALRGGVHFINYLDAGNYLGIEKEAKLIELGLEKELGRETLESKQPAFVVSDKFEFDAFDKQPQFSLAQSLFTHLNSWDICLCLEKLREFVEPGHTFFATFIEGKTTVNHKTSHSHVGFRYSKEQMASLGRHRGWNASYIEDWQHPRNQKLMQFVAV